MTFLEKLNTIERLDQLIRLKATGTPNALAEKLGVSRRCVFNIIDVMKEMNAPIKFCNHKQSYFYERDCELAIGFVDKRKIVGGKNIKNNKENYKNYWSAKFMHSVGLNLSQIAI